jgi:hypothetical protein
MSDDIEMAAATLNSFVTEALKLRFDVHMPSVGASPEQLSESLLDVRRRLDRVEDLVGRSVLLTAACRQGYLALKADADDDWDQALVRQRKTPVGHNDEFAAAKERYALATMDVLDKRRIERSARELADHAVAATEVLKLSLRGLSETRQDLLGLLRHIQFETTLDR